MKELSKEAWIIMYTWNKPEDWMGCFPSELHQWFVVQYKESKIPRIFDSKQDCIDYIEHKALVDAAPIQVAGTNAKMGNYCNCTEEPMWAVGGMCVSCGKVKNNLYNEK